MALGKEITGKIIFFLTNLCRVLALGKEKIIFFSKNLCRVPLTWALSKAGVRLDVGTKFAECLSGTRQRTLCRVNLCRVQMGLCRVL
jgi:hypothetical protein